jgi:hypothetical protein
MDRQIKLSLSVFLLFILATTSLFGQRWKINELMHSKYYWTKIVNYDSISEIKQVTRTKRLFLFDRTTRFTKCYLRTVKYYEKGKFTRKEYYTITVGGCKYARLIEKKHKKRFPNFTVFRFKVCILGNLGMISQLYGNEVTKRDSSTIIKRN